MPRQANQNQGVETSLVNRIFQNYLCHLIDPRKPEESFILPAFANPFQRTILRYTTDDHRQPQEHRLPGSNDPKALGLLQAGLLGWRHPNSLASAARRESSADLASTLNCHSPGGRVQAKLTSVDSPPNTVTVSGQIHQHLPI
jgi:hypothetical protein